MKLFLLKIIAIAIEDVCPWNEESYLSKAFLRQPTAFFDCFIFYQSRITMN